MAKQKQIPLYLFTGFLDSGKTTFIQSTLEDKRFNEGQKTLLVLCEDGEVEYDFGAFSGNNVFLRRIEDEQELTEETLNQWVEETRAVRVIMEYNGMWPLQTLFDAAPENWVFAQEISFADAGTYSVYNANMRNLVFDKLKTCNVMEFNRCDDSTDTDALHKLVRQVNRRCNIFYEYTDGRSVMDDKQDPLPFDVNAPVVAVEDRDYAYFFADLMENSKDYEKKTVSFKAFCPKDGKPLPEGIFVAGRMLMNCCAADTQFAGLACYYGMGIERPAKGSWITVKGKIRLQRNKLFAEKIPVLDVIAVEKAEEPEEDVVTFY